MNYQKIACWGDSQTFGSRTYGCYPMHLVQLLDADSRYTWAATNLSENGLCARDLWFRIGTEASQLDDFHQVCLLIGANDASNGTPVKLFAEYYRQILNHLLVNKFRAIYCGEIPPMDADGHAFFTREAAARVSQYNQAIEVVVRGVPEARLVRFPSLDSSCFVDPAHFNEKGNYEVAKSYAAAIRAN